MSCDDGSISVAEAKRRLDVVAEPLRHLSYDQLKEYARAQGLPFGDWGVLEVEVDGMRTEVNILMSDWGVRRRISVELNLNEIEEGPSWKRSCVYFERFKSGHLDEAEGVGLIEMFAKLFVVLLVVLLPLMAVLYLIIAWVL